MITYSIIPKSQLEGANRLDAEYYQPEYLNVISKLKSQKSKPLSEFLKLLYRYPTFYNLQYYGSGVLVLKGEDILPEGFIQNQSQDYISVEDATRFPKTVLKQDDLIFSVRGYVGKVGIVDKKYDGSIISANLIRAVVKDYSPYFLWVFFNSRYGISQINRVKMITAQETIIADDIKKILIPFVKLEQQLEVERCAKEAIAKIRESGSFYSQAENLLLEEVGLKGFAVEDDLSFIVNLSDVKSAHRADAEYFQPIYEKLLDRIDRKIVISDIQKFNKRGVQPKYVEDGEVKVVTSKHLGLTSLDYESLDQTTFEEWERNHEAQIRKLDILIYTTGANVGRTNCYLERDRALASNHINILRVKRLNPIYVAVFLNSILGQPQVKRLVSGSAQAELYPSDIAKFVVWNAPEEIQQKIASFVRQSHEARKRAKELLEEAKRKVDDMIEKGGKNSGF